MAMLVPPTEVTHGSEVGYSACAREEPASAPQPLAGLSSLQSPEEK